MTDTGKKASSPTAQGDLKEIAIRGIEEGIRQLEYRSKGLAEPAPAELRRMAEERYESSKHNGDDKHLGSA